MDEKSPNKKKDKKKKKKDKKAEAKEVVEEPEQPTQSPSSGPKKKKIEVDWTTLPPAKKAKRVLLECKLCGKPLYSDSGKARHEKNCGEEAFEGRVRFTVAEKIEVLDLVAKAQAEGNPFPHQEAAAAKGINKRTVFHWVELEDHLRAVPEDRRNSYRLPPGFGVSHSPGRSHESATKETPIETESSEDLPEEPTQSPITAELVNEMSPLLQSDDTTMTDTPDIPKTRSKTKQKKNSRTSGGSSVKKKPKTKTRNRIEAAPWQPESFDPDNEIFIDFDLETTPKKIEFPEPINHQPPEPERFDVIPPPRTSTFDDFMSDQFFQKFK